MSTTLTTGKLKQFSQLAWFTDASLEDATTAVNDFITDELDADPYSYYVVKQFNSYFDGSNHVIQILYDRFEITVESEA